MNTVHIHIRGRVQGVGFRPMVYRVAHALGLRGEVSNHSDGVHIFVHADEAEVVEFTEHLIEAAPSNAIIEGVQTRVVPAKIYSTFEITRSASATPPDLWITPDFGVCQACINEMRDREDRRYGYPFITCTHCGPRYSIITGLPYDRPLTTMEPFAMCPDCASEYNDVHDRRFYAQTNSCAECAVRLQLRNLENGRVEEDQDLCIDEAVQAILEGKILAVKGIGGYLLMADATNKKAIRLLRKRKNRPCKPLALIYPSLERLQEDVILSEQEQSAWFDPSSPILLYRYNPSASDSSSMADCPS